MQKNKSIKKVKGNNKNAGKNKKSNDLSDKSGYFKLIVKILLAALVCILAISAVLYKLGNEKNSSEDENVTSLSLDFYYVDTVSSTMKSEKKEIKGKDNAEIISSALTELKKGPVSEELVSPIPENVNFNSATLDGEEATVDISSEYLNMKSGEELLCRGSIVWTLTGLDFIKYVKITVNGDELKQTNGQPMGKMSRDDIVIDAVVSPETTNYETVKLYFSNDESTGLESEERKIEVNPNQPLEKYIVEQLIAGPKDKDLVATIPPETKIRDIKTIDGICYLDLSSEFVTKHNGGSTGETLTIYSIVNSLAELDKINKVQFLIEGEKQAEFKGHIDFSKPFEPMDVNV